MENLLLPVVEQALREACYEERFASNLYTHIANQMQRLGFFGAEKFFRSEASDELSHYGKLVSYFNDRGSIAPVPAIEEMDEKVAGLKEALNLAFATEKSLGEMYAKWYALVFPKDPVTAQFLLEFLEIQRKSIGEYGDLLSRINIAGDNTAALLMIDAELGE